MPSFPGGLLIASGLHSLPVKCFFSLPVVLKNETQSNTVIPPKTVIAELHAVQQVIDKPLASDASETPENPRSPQITFDFGDSPLPSEWKEWISALLNSMPEGFQIPIHIPHCSSQKDRQLSAAMY